MTVHAVIVVCGQLVPGLLLLLYAALFKRGIASDSQAVRRQASHGTAKCKLSEEHRKHLEWQAAHRDQNIFCGHVRTEDNFILGNSDPKLTAPPGSPLEIEAHYKTRRVLYTCVLRKLLKNLLPLTVGGALTAGGVGSILCFHPHSEDFDESIMITGTLSGRLISDFKWLPLFMFGGHIAFYTQRWRQFMFAAWSVEGRLKDLGIILGAEVADSDDLCARQLMFKLYRYMVLAMALQYKAHIPALQEMGSDLSKGLQGLGLLTESEAAVLVPAGSRMRDTVLSWIARDISRNGPSKSGLIDDRGAHLAFEKLTACRASMMYFHGNKFYPQPNMLAAFMKLLVDIYCALMILGYPFSMFASLAQTYLYGFQPFTVLTVFLMTLSFWDAESLTLLLAAPFENEIDTFNLDALIAGTEQTLFASMRSSFDDQPRGLPSTLKSQPAEESGQKL